MMKTKQNQRVLHQFHAMIAFTNQERVLSDTIVEVIKAALLKQLSKDIWSNLMEKHPEI